MVNTAHKEIQQLLYEHPLCNWMVKNEETMRVLVVGSTEHAIAFVDLCLQVGQMIDKQLEIYWCLPDLEEKENYLMNRPALREFVSIDLDEIEDPYAHLFFYEQERYIDPFAEKCRYIFAATDDKEMNEETASLFKQASGTDCLAACLADGVINVSFNGEPDSPEFVEKKNANEFLDTKSELERMAFNTHCVWNGGGNISIKKVKEDFHDEYNYNSSVSFVLSIRYKFKSIDIDIDDSNIYAAAKEFYGFVKKAEQKKTSEEAKLLARVAYLEHRRWVMEKAVNGMVLLEPADFSACIDNGSLKVVDSQGNMKKNQCLLRSTEEMPLSDGTYSDDDWDNEQCYKDKQLDDLDRMSINLHRLMKKRADDLKAVPTDVFESLKVLYDLCSREGNEIIRDFRRYELCIKNVLGDSKPHAAQFDIYEKALERRLNDISSEEGIIVTKAIRKRLFPVLEFSRYRDYKKYDMDLVAQIPAILTKRKDVHICAPLGETSSAKYCNDENFKSVASATALGASKVTYLHVLEQTTNCELFYSKIKAINNYYEYREADCSIDLIAFIKKGKDTGKEIGRKKIEYKEKVDQIEKEGLVEKASIVEYKNDNELAEKIFDAVEELTPDYFDGTNLLSISPRTNEIVLSAVTQDKDGEKIPYFEFDSNAKAFKHCPDCDYLQYQEITSFIRIEDMFALMNAQDIKFAYEDYADSYMDYWNICTGRAIGQNNMLESITVWNMLCDTIYDYFKKKYYDHQREAVAEADGTFRVEKPMFKKIVKRSSKNQSTIQRRLGIIKEMLYELHRNGYIESIVEHEEKITSIVIKSYKVKKVLEKAGTVLELYVYHKVCETDWYDDVQAGYYFKWEYEDVENELDCVMTKGFNSMIVECKTSNTYNFEGVSVYPKLDSLSNHFGIGCKKVLVWPADTSYRKYQMHKARGEQLDIITISEREKLEDIGNELIKIMEQ